MSKYSSRFSFSLGTTCLFNVEQIPPASSYYFENSIEDRNLAILPISKSGKYYMGPILITLIRVIQNLYGESRSRQKLDNILTPEFLVTKKPSQSFVCPQLFSKYILQKTYSCGKKCHGMNIEENTICMNVLQFKNGSVVMTNNIKEME